MSNYLSFSKSQLDALDVPLDDVGLVGIFLAIGEARDDGHMFHSERLQSLKNGLRVADDLLLRHLSHFANVFNLLSATLA